MLKVVVLLFVAVAATNAKVIGDLDNWDDRIVNGENAVNGQFPWSGRTVAGTSACSCSLFRLNRVLTAGHCNPNSVAGTTWFGNVNRNDGIQRTFGAANVFLHPSYGVHSGFDIAIYHLPTPYVQSEFIAPIALPLDNLNSFENQQGIMHGFGRMAGDVQAPILQWTNFNALSRAECSTITSTPFIICGRYPTASTCAGDSGGGFIMNDNGVWRLFGVHSFRIGPTTCTANNVGGSVRVSEHLTWIQSYT